VSFAHPRPRDIAPLQRFFGTEAITFGADETSLVLPVAALDLPLDAHLEVDAVSTLSMDPAPSRARVESMWSLVAASLPELLARGATLEAVARSLGMSDRTLQRRLEGEGTSFLEIQDAVREARARELLRDLDLPLLDVADQLGFSDLATFSRAFKRWTGHPPGMFRRKSIA
jgi:AraC-like DNA-binding protein